MAFAALLVGAAAVGQTLPPGVINAPPTVIGDDESIGSDTTLNVFDGGQVGARFNVGLPDGSSTSVFANINGGTVAYGLVANAGSAVAFDGGSSGTVTARGGSDLRVSGGRVDHISAESGSRVTLSGGRTGGLDAAPGSALEIVGGDFRLNGVPYADLSLMPEVGDVLTGTYADGTPFIFRQQPSFWWDDVVVSSFKAVALPPIDTTPIVLDGPSDGTLLGLREGQSLEVRDSGAAFDSIYAVGAHIRVAGGSAERIELAESSLAVTAGIVNRVDALAESVVTVDGGRVFQTLVYRDSELHVRGGEHGSVQVFSGGVFNLHDGHVRYMVNSPSSVRGAVVNVSGGFVGGRSAIGDGMTANITGGEVRSWLLYSGSETFLDGGSLVLVSAFPGSTLTITGGTFDRVSLSAGSTVHIVATDLQMDGVDLSLQAGVPTALEQRDAALSGVLTEGTSFELALDRINPDATLTVTLLPDPGDYNGDTLVDTADYDAWRAAFGQEVVPYSGADGNGDGVVDAADFTVWRDAIGGGGVGAPEPGGVGLVAMVVACWAAVRRGRCASAGAFAA